MADCLRHDFNNIELGVICLKLVIHNTISTLEHLRLIISNLVPSVLYPTLVVKVKVKIYKPIGTKCH